MAAPKGNKNAVGNKGGRPSKFRADIGPKLIAYYQRHATMSKRELKEKIPSLIQFIIEEDLNISKQTMGDWAAQGAALKDEKRAKYTKLEQAKIEFTDIYKRAMDMQREVLIRGGLWSAFHPTAFIFVAKNETDMRDKVEHEITEKHMLVLDADED